ncbi:flavin reductase family protein [Nocardia cyriacigeorgica]|uniref:Flavin reductase family protein n=1 Tax=Nocardia cyriacigeorgica TaxID=135487 RepID=A0A6P1CWK0_9NOCA|nr:flavin reductase family protein [Nocardia cyriacigeorgica]NEW36033.1 flavin reductase family protein [Nocardia cyriacigeorgica]
MTSIMGDADMEAPAAVDPLLLRSAMGRFATGVTVISNASETGDVHAMTANAFMSVSLDPALVLVSLGNRAKMAARLGDSDHYGVSILAHSQESIARRFAGSQHPMPPPLFDWLGRVPVVAGSLVQLGARIVDRHIAGDHTLFIAEVQQLQLRDGEPLLFHTGSFKLVQVGVTNSLWES